MHPQQIDLMARNLRSYLDDQKHGLRPHQVDALEQVRKFLKLPIGAPFSTDNPESLRHQKRGDFFEIVSATGTGKTRMFGCMAKGMGVPTLILTPRNILNTQARDEFCQDIGIKAADIAVYDGTQPTRERRRGLNPVNPPQFLVATYQSLPSLIRQGVQFNHPESPEYRPLIILDEVHTAQGKETSKLIKNLRRTNLVAGFTATDAGAKDTLFEGQAPIYNLPLVQAIKDGFLCESVRADTVEVQIKSIGSFSSRMANLYDDVIAKLRSSTDKAVARDAFNHVLEDLGVTSGVARLTDTQMGSKEGFLESILQVEERWASVYPGEDKFAGFLQEVQHHLPAEHPLKTYTADVDWLRNFKEELAGKDYREQDIHKFALDSSVIQGAIQHHLITDDEELGRLYKYPTIFYTEGIDAAEKGAIKFNEMAKSMGLDVKADFISGEMDKTERDNKLLAFKEGRIQALWNDRVLEMGFNDKNATIAYSLKPSRLSHVAEQQLGRVARKEDKDYFERFGRHKHALAINVIGPGMRPFLFSDVLKGKEPLYAANDGDYFLSRVGKLCKLMASKKQVTDKERIAFVNIIPELLGEFEEPLTTETIGDAKEQLADAIRQTYHYTPYKLKKFLGDLQSQMGGSYPSVLNTILMTEVTSTLPKPDWPDNIKVDTSPGNTVQVQVESGEEHAPLPEKGTFWKTSGEIAALLGVEPNDPALHQLWDRIEEFYQTGTAVIDNHLVSCEYRKNGTHSPFCIAETEVDWLKTQREKLHWKSQTEFKDLFGLGKDPKLTKGPYFDALWEQIEMAYRTNPDEPVLTNGHNVNCGLITRHDQPIFCLYQDEKDWFADQIRAILREKDENWRTKEETALRLPMNPNDPFFNDMWERMVTSYDAKASPENLCPEIDLDGMKFQVGLRRMEGGEEVFCVHSHGLSWLSQEKAKDPRLNRNAWFTLEDLTRAECMQMGVRDKNDAVLRGAWQMLVSQSSKNTYKVKIDGRDVLCAYIPKSAIAEFCLHESEREWFISYVKELKETAIAGANGLALASGGWRR